MKKLGFDLKSKSMKKSLKDNEIKLDESGIDWGDNKKIFKDTEINKELMNSNPLLYNLNFNSFKTDEKIYDNKISKDKINIADMQKELQDIEYNQTLKEIGF